MIVSNMKMFLRYTPCFFSKAVFFSIFIILLVSPVLADISEGSAWGVTYWSDVDSAYDYSAMYSIDFAEVSAFESNVSAITYSGWSDPATITSYKPDYLKINWALYSGLEIAHGVSYYTVSLPADFGFTSDFELISSEGYHVGGGYVSVWKGTDNKLNTYYQFTDRWNYTYTSTHQELTQLNIIFNASGNVYDWVDVPGIYYKNSNLNIPSITYYNTNFYFSTNPYNVYAMNFHFDTVVDIVQDLTYKYNDGSELGYINLIRTVGNNDAVATRLGVSTNITSENTEGSNTYSYFTNYISTNTSYVAVRTSGFLADLYTTPALDYPTFTFILDAGGGGSSGAFADPVPVGGTNDSVESYISFYGEPFYEGGVAYIDFDVKRIRSQYPYGIIRLEVAVPKADEPYYTYNVFDLVANSGRKMVDIGYKSEVYRAYDSVFAYIRVYNATSHVTLLSISEPVLNSTHEILAFSRPYYNEYDNAVLKYDLGDFYTYADPGTFTITTSFNGFLVDETDNVKVLSKHVFGELPQSEYSFFIGSLTDTNVSGVMSAQITYQDFTNSSSIPINISDLIFVSVYGAANETYPYIPEEYDPEPVYGDYPSHFLNFSSDALNITWFKAYLDSVDSTVGSFGLPVFKFFSWVVSPIVSLTSTINEFNVALEGVYDNAGVSLNAIGGAISSIYTYLPAKVLSALVLSLFFTVLLLLWKGNGGG